MIKVIALVKALLLSKKRPKKILPSLKILILLRTNFLPEYRATCFCNKKNGYAQEKQSITHLARFCSNEHQQGETQRMGKSCCESLQDKAAGMEPEIIELKKLLLKEQIRTSELKKRAN